MKTTDKILAICVSAALLSVSTAVDAQVRGPRNIAYAYGHTLELQAGWAGSCYGVGDAKGLASGGIWDLRYTGFFSRHWGFYAQIGTAGTQSSAAEFFGRVNAADGGLYKYSTTDNNRFYGNLPGFSCNPTFTVGAAYRYDFGGWSLRPRVGIGVASCEIDDVKYVRYPRSGANAEPEFFSITPAAQGEDYLVDQNYQSFNCPTSINLAASLQLTYTLGRHFFYSAEVGADVMPKKVNFIHRQYSAQPAYDPQTWADAIYQSDLQGSYTCNESDYTETGSSHIAGCLIHAKLGFGWNIGWNRNEGGRRRR